MAKARNQVSVHDTLSTVKTVATHSYLSSLFFGLGGFLKTAFQPIGAFVGFGALEAVNAIHGIYNMTVAVKDRRDWLNAVHIYSSISEDKAIFEEIPEKKSGDVTDRQYAIIKKQEINDRIILNWFNQQNFTDKERDNKKRRMLAIAEMGMTNVVLSNMMAIMSSLAGALGCAFLVAAPYSSFAAVSLAPIAPLCFMAAFSFLAKKSFQECIYHIKAGRYPDAALSGLQGVFYVGGAVTVAIALAAKLSFLALFANPITLAIGGAFVLGAACIFAYKKRHVIKSWFTSNKKPENEENERLLGHVDEKEFQDTLNKIRQDLSLKQESEKQQNDSDLAFGFSANESSEDLTKNTIDTNSFNFFLPNCVPNYIPPTPNYENENPNIVELNLD